MPNKSFLSHLKEQVRAENSALRRSIATTVLQQKDSMQAATIIINDIFELAKEQDASESTKRLKNPSGDMLSRVSNAIFYNAKSVTIAPNRPSSSSKSPKYIADKVLEEVIDTLCREIDDE